MTLRLEPRSSWRPSPNANKARPTRFSDGSYGVYYAGHTFETALREVAFHMGRFMRRPPTRRTRKLRTYKAASTS